jgi:hypothetical protein
MPRLCQGYAKVMPRFKSLSFCALGGSLLQGRSGLGLVALAFFGAVVASLTESSCHDVMMLQNFIIYNYDHQNFM